MSAETSPAGEAASSTESSDKDSSVVCPTCGRDDFKSLNGMSAHHTKVHGEKLDTRAIVSCEFCGNEFKIHQYRLNEADRHFCPESDCYSEWQSHHRTGEDSFRWTGDGEELECRRCGETFYAIPSRVDEAEYCSRECAHPEKRKTTVCEVCGDEFEVPDCRFGDARFCGFECKGKWQSKAYLGKNNPWWNGGYGWYYGPNWKRQRRKAQKRDQYKCQICGKDERDLRRIPDTHHIIKIRKFKEKYDDPEWYEKGNRLDNLILLCEEHHKKWEGIPLRPQLL